MNTKVKHADDVLRLQGSSGKLSNLVMGWSLPAGWTCPGADKCHSRVMEKTGKIKDYGEYRCYDAALEMLYPSYRKQVWHNLKVITPMSRNACEMVDLFERSIYLHNPQMLINMAGILRPHCPGGDFHTLEYCLAIRNLAHKWPNLLIYFYTKSLKLWEEVITTSFRFPNNLVINASMDGKNDDIAHKLQLKRAHVVFDKQEAKDRGLPIDHDDTIAMRPAHNFEFALLLHGAQPKGSEAAKAVYQLKKKGFHGYNAKRKEVDVDNKTADVYQGAMRFFDQAANNNKEISWSRS
jgi:hypothetical protein